MNALHRVRYLLISILVTLPCRADITTGLQIHWSFDDGIIPGTVHGNPQIVYGKKGKAVRFDGVSDWINSGSTFFPRAISIYIRPEGNPSEVAVAASITGAGITGGTPGRDDYDANHMSVSCFRGLPAPFWSGYYSSSTFRWQQVVNLPWYSGPSASSQGGIPMKDTYTHVVATVENGSLKLYVGGQLVQISPLAGGGDSIGQGTPPAFFNLAADSGGNARFQGVIDEVKVYSRSLTASDVAELKAQFDATNDHLDAPAGWWNFADFVLAKLPDRTGNGLDATVEGAARIEVVSGMRGLRFNANGGSGDRLTLPMTPLSTPVSALTISAMLRLDPVLPDGIFLQGPGFHLASVNGNTAMQFTTPPGGSRLFQLPKDSWQHFVFSTDGTRERVMVNGVEAINTPIGGPIFTELAWQLNGRTSLRDLRLWRRGLSDVEIASLFAELNRGWIAGNVTAPHWRPSDSIIVQASDSDPGLKVVLSKPGGFKIPLVLGVNYPLSAFWDISGNGVREPDEPMTVHSNSPILATGEMEGLNLSLPAPLDSDGDGLPDAWERRFGGSPTAMSAVADLDGDGLPNLEEFLNGSAPNNSDTDLDGADDGVERLSGTNASLADTDGDGMGDGWEVMNGLNPLINDASEDRDLDGLTNKEEYDHRAEGYKANAANSKAGLPGDDRLSDYRRLKGEGWVHHAYDRDDRLIATERDSGLLQTYVYDGNSQKNRDFLTNSLDADGDGLPDAWEFAHGLAFAGLGAGSGGNGATGDPDHDGFTNAQERKAGSDPMSGASRPSLGASLAGAPATVPAGFTPTNWVMATGQLDGFGAEEIFVGSDGAIGAATNEVKMFTRMQDGTWSAESIPVGMNGITSLAFGVPSPGYGPTLYTGNRPASGPGTITEFRRVGAGWTTPSAPLAKSDGTGVAHVVGVSTAGGLVSRLTTDAATNGIFRQELSSSVTVKIPASTTWGQLLSGSPDATGQSQLGTNQQFARWVSSNGSQRALLKFQLPAGVAKITGITLNLKATSANSGEEVKIHRLSNTAFTAAATWNKFDGVSNWTTPGGDYAAAAMATVPSAAWVASSVNSITLDATGIAWGDSVALILKRTSEGNNSGVGASWFSPGATLATDRPYLELTIVPGDLGSWTPPALVDGSSGASDWPTMVGVGPARWLDAGGIRFRQLAAPSPSLGAVQGPTNGNFYFLTPSAIGWTAAEQFAAANGGHLVTVNDAAENQWLTGQFGAHNPWIGLYREPNSNLLTGWQWVSGSSSAFRDWSPGQPDAGNGELKAQLLNTGKWNDNVDAANYRGIVEVEIDSSEPATLPGPAITASLVWRGRSFFHGKLRATTGVFNSLCYALIDDKAAPAGAGAGDEFVVGEYDISGGSPVLRTNQRVPLLADSSTGAYSLAVVRCTSDGKPGSLVVGEPDGTVSLWTAPDETSPLVRKVFTTEFAGKAWHQMEPLREAEGREGLVGLLVDPATPNQCQVITWSPETIEAALNGTAPVLNHAPLARVLPVPSSGGGNSTVGVRIWDAEAHASTVVLQFQRVGESLWNPASVVKVDGAAGTAAPLSSAPGGVSHTLTWNAAADLGVAFNGTVLLRTRAADAMTGEWSEPMPYIVDISSDLDTDGDGVTDAGERAFGTDPLVFSSVPLLTSTRDPGGLLHFSWSFAPGRNYRLEASADLVTWTEVQVVTGGQLTLQPGQETLRFYRVAAVLP